MARAPAKASISALTARTRVAVLAGKDGFLRSEFTAQLARTLEAEHGEVDRLRFDGATTPLADVLDECRSFGLMQQHKLVVVDEADQLVKDANRPLLERYCESPPDGATLLLRCERWFKGKLDKLIEDPERGAGAIVPCDAPTEAQAEAWALRRAKARHGAEIERDAAGALVARVGADLGRIDTELAKLAASAGGGAITKAMVVEQVGATREDEVWGIQAMLLGAPPEATLLHLRDLIRVSRQPTVLIGYALCDIAAKLHAARVMLDAGRQPRDIA